jgi:thymidylate synthase (FAD)
LKNSVELIDCYGSDERHALSAWTSTSRELTDEKRARIPKLLKFLAENGHHTPFEKSFISFLVTCDTASHIHLLKHRIGVSVNGESARYKELKDDRYYVPEDWPIEEQRVLDHKVSLAWDNYHGVLRNLVNMGVERKRAKESARFYLPYATQVTLDVSFNFRSFMHFQKLRNAEDAQEEIHQIADDMLGLVILNGNFNYSLEAFGYGISGVG